jgi:anaerobic selenocysteine-containing dehydrogenase
MAKLKLDYYNQHKNDWQWQEGDLTATRTTHWSGPGCHNGCGVIYYTKDNKLVKCEGDPHAPFNRGKLCMRCLNLPENVNHPERLKWPLKRVGERGENKWERVSWDEAYDIIVSNVRRIQKDYGAESICAMVGTGRNVCDQVPFFCYAAFESPNASFSFLSGDTCFCPRAAEMAVMNGDFFIADCSQQFEQRYDTVNTEWRPPEVIMIWGNNPVISNADGFFGHWIVDLMRMGSKLLVVDPELTWLAAQADCWIRLRPGTDSALGMAMLNTIISEDLYDHEFVEKWTYGFEDLKKRCAEWPAAKVAEICWVDQETIESAARMYAKASPAMVQWGLAVDMSVPGIASAATINSMWAICGNVDVPGGNIIIRNAFDQYLSYGNGFHTCLTQEQRDKRLGYIDYPMKKASNFSALAYADSVLKAIETGEPYPVKMTWIQSSNPLANMGGEAPRLYDALRSLDFNVVVDLFMTPTAVACADIVLPCAMSNERDSQRVWWTPLRTMVKVTQYEECKTDEQIIIDLGRRLKPENFPFTNNIEWVDFIFKNHTRDFPYTFEQMKEKIWVYPEFQYRKYEKGMLREDGEPGFNTTTGKIELSMTLFELWEYDPLPWYEEPRESPYSTPALAKEYPFVLTTGARSWEFFHSEQRQVKTMREFHPDPLVRLNRQSAEALGIHDGDWVWLENTRGRCRQRAKLSDALHPQVVCAEHGWWFPELDGAEPSLYGVFDANSNNLTTQFVNGPTGYGAPYKNQICKVYKATEANSVSLPTQVVTREGGFKYERQY